MLSPLYLKYAMKKIFLNGSLIIYHIKNIKTTKNSHFLLVDGRWPVQTSAGTQNVLRVFVFSSVPLPKRQDGASN
jgi:hypothetical protein